MNPEERYIPEVPLEPCDCLTSFQQSWDHPFKRPVAVLDQYEKRAGAWVVEGYVVNEDLDGLEPNVRYVRLEFCPFCGSPLTSGARKAVESRKEKEHVPNDASPKKSKEK